MESHSRRVLLVFAAGAAVFASAVAAGLRLVPEPRTQLDYLVIGSLATFLMLGAVFGLILMFWVKPREFLAQRRRKQASTPQTPPE
jgi:hypothetical protein